MPPPLPDSLEFLERGSPEREEANKSAGVHSGKNGKGNVRGIKRKVTRMEPLEVYCRTALERGWMSDGDRPTFHRDAEWVRMNASSDARVRRQALLPSP